MKKMLSVSALVLIMVSLFSISANCQTSKKPTSAVAKTSKVEVYYFHYTRRCVTCNAVETETQKTITTIYPDQAKKRQITFKSINLDEKSSEALAKKCNASDALGIDFEEKAFYDILKELCIKYDFTYPENKLIELAKAVKELVEGQAKFPDWNKRDDIKSALKVGLILLLDEFGYPPVERDEVYVEIFEQAENFKKNQC